MKEKVEEVMAGGSNPPTFRFIIIGKQKWMKKLKIYVKKQKRLMMSRYCFV